MATTVPDFFARFPMRPVTSSTLDDILAESDASRLSILFLWGMDCPNCDIAKRSLLQRPDRFAWTDVRWLHDNVYDDIDLATRFGLHGIPVFLVFHRKKLRGRITSWPGGDAFVAAIERQLALTA